MRSLQAGRIAKAVSLDGSVYKDFDLRNAMFLVEDHPYGTTYLVFTYEDPRRDGFRGGVVEGVRLDYDMEAVHRWPDGQARPEPCVGRDKDDPNHYKVFKNSRDRESAGYQSVTGTPLVFGSWSDYTRLHFDPPDPQQTDEQRWYDYLDKVDEASRRRRQWAQTLPAPRSGGRDEVAAWLAKKHIIVDSAIREVWYLPQGAPADEIRLLEVNDRLAGSESKVEAIDFGLDVEGAPLRLFVADITSDQLAQIRQEPSRLPAGWSLGGATSWSRRGA